VTDEKKIREITRSISPLYFVDPKDPPILVIHGDADVLVPYEQATRFMEKLEEAGVEHKLVTKPGAGHGWANIQKDTPTIADWFDAKLLTKTPATTQATAATEKAN
jgi:dipeptidyl aminopeptidase/acylaminoacyl peptidase